MSLISHRNSITREYCQSPSYTKFITCKLERIEFGSYITMPLFMQYTFFHYRISTMLANCIPIVNAWTVATRNLRSTHFASLRDFSRDICTLTLSQFLANLRSCITFNFDLSFRSRKIVYNFESTIAAPRIFSANFTIYINIQIFNLRTYINIYVLNI